MSNPRDKVARLWTREEFLQFAASLLQTEVEAGGEVWICRRVANGYGDGTREEARRAWYAQGEDHCRYTAALILRQIIEDYEHGKGK
jgi:hypothetical protein